MKQMVKWGVLSAIIMLAGCAGEVSDSNPSGTDGVDELQDPEMDPNNCQDNHTLIWQAESLGPFDLWDGVIDTSGVAHVLVADLDGSLRLINSQGDERVLSPAPEHHIKGAVLTMNSEGLPCATWATHDHTVNHVCGFDGEIETVLNDLEIRGHLVGVANDDAEELAFWYQGRLSAIERFSKGRDWSASELSESSISYPGGAVFLDAELDDGFGTDLGTLSMSLACFVTTGERLGLISGGDSSNINAPLTGVKWCRIARIEQNKAWIMYGNDTETHHGTASLSFNPLLPGFEALWTPAGTLDIEPIKTSFTSLHGEREPFVKAALHNGQRELWRYDEAGLQRIHVADSGVDITGFDALPAGVRPTRGIHVAPAGTGQSIGHTPVVGRDNDDNLYSVVVGRGETSAGTWGLYHTKHCAK